MKELWLTQKALRTHQSLKGTKNGKDLVVVPIHLEKTVGSWRYLLLAAPYSARSRIVKRCHKEGWWRWLCVCSQAPCEYAVWSQVPTRPSKNCSSGRGRPMRFWQKSIVINVQIWSCSWYNLLIALAPLGMVLWYVLTTHFGTEVTSFPRFLLVRLVSSNGVHWFLDEVIQQAFRSGFFLAAALHIAPSFGRRRGGRSRKTDCRAIQQYRWEGSCRIPQAKMPLTIFDLQIILESMSWCLQLTCFEHLRVGSKLSRGLAWVVEMGLYFNGSNEVWEGLLAAASCC